MEGIPVWYPRDTRDTSGFLKQWGCPSLLKCCGKSTSVKRGVDDMSECGDN